jgi:hypothetical protein
MIRNSKHSSLTLFSCSFVVDDRIWIIIEMKELKEVISKEGRKKREGRREEREEEKRRKQTAIDGPT